MVGANAALRREHEGDIRVVARLIYYMDERRTLCGAECRIPVAAGTVRLEKRLPLLEFRGNGEEAKPRRVDSRSHALMGDPRRLLIGGTRRPLAADEGAKEEEAV